jgi:germination protein M
MKKRLLVFGVIILVVTFLAGCLGQSKQDNDTTEQPQTETNQQNEETPAEETIEFTVYFSDDEAMYLKGEKRAVPKDDRPVAELMIEELIKGPKSQDLMPTIPEGTKLLSLEVKEKIAIVNFSKEIQTNHPGGTTGESMTVYSIVHTLTQLPDIEAVKFLVEGEEQEAIWGHLYTLEPIEPNPDLLQ